MKDYYKITLEVKVPNSQAYRYVVDKLREVMNDETIFEQYSVLTIKPLGGKND